MKASDFFSNRGKPAPSLPVRFRLVDNSGEEQRTADGEAVFRFVPDRLKCEADGDAEKALGSLKVPVTPEIRAAYEQAAFLHTALRDKAAPLEPFFDTADECRAMLMPSERLRLLAAYANWVEQQFPPDWTPAKLQEAIKDAGNFSLPTLLNTYGYDIARNCLIFFVLNPTTSPTT